MVKTASDLICDLRACSSNTLAYLHMYASLVVPPTGVPRAPLPAS